MAKPLAIPQTDDEGHRMCVNMALYRLPHTDLSPVSPRWSWEIVSPPQREQAQLLGRAPDEAGDFI